MSSTFTAFTGVFLIVELFFFVVAIVAWVKIVSKAGYSGWWVLIGLVPLVGSIFVLVFAFSTWPVTREVEMLRSQVGARGYGRGGGYGPDPASGDPGPGPGPIGPGERAPEDVSMPSFGQFMR